MRLYATEEHHDILSISWCPRGDFLASASLSSECHGMERIPRHWHATSMRSWAWCQYSPLSHNSFYLFAGAFTNKVFIWETRSWRCESWSLSKGCANALHGVLMESFLYLQRQGHKFAVDISVASHIPPRIDGLLMKIKLDVGVFWETDRKGKGYTTEKTAENLGEKGKKARIYP